MEEKRRGRKRSAKRKKEGGQKRIEKSEEGKKEFRGGRKEGMEEDRRVGGVRIIKKMTSSK